MTNSDTTRAKSAGAEPNARGDATDPSETQDKTVVAKGIADELKHDLQLASPGISAGNRKPPTQNGLVGTRLGGRFEILEVLGSGGMSVVYKARQEVVDRFVAIKTLKLQLQGQPETIQRFEREIRSLCKLSHPHIVTVFDCIIDEDGQPYIAMDYLVGKSMDMLLREKRLLSPEEAQPLLVQICSALDHAHKHGIVHRDLKPSNIMLVGDDLEFVKVVDFGLARLGQENQKITRSGEIWGSPPYMSPEQCNGSSCDGRSDIYSLGVVMYEMLSGKDPFTSEQVVHTLMKHLNEPPPPFPPEAMVPAVWQGIVFKCLEKDPAKRFQTMGALKEALIAVGKQSLAIDESKTVKQVPLPLSRARAAYGEPFYRTLAFKLSLLAVTVVALVITLRATVPTNNGVQEPKSVVASPDSTANPGGTSENHSPAGGQEANSAVGSQPPNPSVKPSTANKVSEQPKNGPSEPTAESPASGTAGDLKPTANRHANALANQELVKSPGRQPLKAHHNTAAVPIVRPTHPPTHPHLVEQHAPSRHIGREEPRHALPPAKKSDPWNTLKSHRSGDD